MKLLHIFWILVFALSCIAAILPTAASNLSSYYGITGVQTGIEQNGGRPERRDITEMATNDPQSMALYIQGLNSMQDVSEDDPLSYYQIAGIHGRPFIEWNKAKQGINSYTTGYCTHGSVLFLTWHRPYLALYEQVLAQHIQAVVQTYDASEQAVYKAKADALRLVYWDWASIPTMPDIILQPTISIVTGTGLQDVRNPFYSYKFQKFPMDPTLFPTANTTDYWLANYNETVRGAAQPGDGNNFDLVNQYLISSDLMRNTWLALTKQTTIDSFSTTALPGTSLEAIHNTIHVDIGCGSGHMTVLAYSAFDPIFWLHHANVDRLFAYWEAMHPLPSEQQMDAKVDGWGTFSIPPGTAVGIQTPLEPFTVTSTGPWYDSSLSNRTTKKFGYTYPGLQDWNMTIDEQQSQAITVMQQLYNPNNQFTKRASTSLHNNLLTTLSQSSLQSREWFVALSVSKFDLRGQRFTVLFYLGTVPQSPLATDASCIGSFPVFPPPIVPNVAGVLPQITTFSEYSLHAGLGQWGVDAEDVAGTAAWLRKALQWVVTRADGSLVDLKDVPSLNVTVYEEVVTRGATAASLPVWEGKMAHVEVTRGRAGGWGS